MPTLWGYSGHLQTVFHSIVGRVKCPWPSGDRIFLTLDDNSTLTYDLYQPLNEPNGMSKTNKSSFTYLFTCHTDKIDQSQTKKKCEMTLDFYDYNFDVHSKFLEITSRYKNNESNNETFYTFTLCLRCLISISICLERSMTSLSFACFLLNI